MFQPGQSGNPGGRPKERPFREALLMELKAAGDDRKELREVARALISKAKSGDVAGAKELIDRLDGKVPQAQIHMGDEDGGPVQFTKVERGIVDPQPQPETSHDGT